MSDIPMNESGPDGAGDANPADEALRSRRRFLIGLGRWSKVVIGAAVFGGLAATESDAQAGAWVNRHGGGWANYHGGGGGWVNRRGGGGWVNRHGGGGGGWVNRHGGGGGGWVNRHGGGGGGWINRR